MSHILDRPAWNALTTRHAALAEGGPLALRYDPAIIPFAAARDDSPESRAAFAALARPGEEMAIAEAGPVTIPDGFSTVFAAPVVQMVLVRAPSPAPDARIERLTEADTDEMLALALLTKPGPFTRRAQALGDFYGIRIDGRLAAMAGERMRVDGFGELSGVCSHPDFRGQGLARTVSVFVSERIRARGETPFLHAFTTNAAAIALYESIGYAVRATLNAALVRREA